MISADVGSPGILRFGEKGMIWLVLRATGRSAHAAHVHRGESAIERRLDAIHALRSVRALPVTAPEDVSRAIAAGAAASEILSGAGEAHTLGHVTLTVGTIRGGRLINLIADAACATADIRLPAGTTVAAAEAEIRRLVADSLGVSIDVIRRYEPD